MPSVALQTAAGTTRWTSYRHSVIRAAVTLQRPSGQQGEEPAASNSEIVDSEIVFTKKITDSATGGATPSSVHGEANVSSI